MKRVIYLILLIVLAVYAGVNAQTRITVNQGDNLITAIAGAASGDTIAIGPGYHKASYTTPIINKSLAFIAVNPKVKPRVYIKQMDVTGTDLNLYFHGINFSTATVDSLIGVEDTITLISADSYILNLTAAHISLTSLILDDCIFRNVGRAVLRGDRAANTIGTFLVNNCLIYDHRGAGDYGPFRVKSNCTITDFTIQNSTFYNISNRLIEMESAPGAPAVLIKNCTFSSWGGGKTGQYLFDMKAVTGTASLSIQSCILGRTNGTDLVVVNGWRIPLQCTLEMTNTAMSPEFIVTDSAYSVVSWDKTEYNLEDFDPSFADPDNGNFFLPVGSDLLQASPDGTIIGDPRWDPNRYVGVRHNYAPDFEVYPNPASGFVTVKCADKGSVTIYNSLGISVKHIDNVVNGSQVIISDLKSGMYFIRMNENSQTSKLIVR
jgi:hypothetical protein